jgi:hypothetical protein
MSPPSKFDHDAVRLVKHNGQDFARQRFVECMLNNFGQRTERTVGKRVSGASIMWTAFLHPMRFLHPNISRNITVFRVMSIL